MAKKVSKETAAKKAHAKEHGFENIRAYKSAGKNRGDGYSVGKDKDGIFVYTHRARSKSYASEIDIPKKERDFIASTS